MEGNFYLLGQIGICNDYIHDGTKQEASIVIHPLKIKEEQNKKADVMHITEGCNRWKACENPTCQFSLIARPVKNA